MNRKLLIPFSTLPFLFPPLSPLLPTLSPTHSPLSPSLPYPLHTPLSLPLPTLSPTHSPLSPPPYPIPYTLPSLSPSLPYPLHTSLSLPLTPSSRDFITIFKFDELNRPFLFSFEFPLLCLPSLPQRILLGFSSVSSLASLMLLSLRHLSNNSSIFTLKLIFISIL